MGWSAGGVVVGGTNGGVPAMGGAAGAASGVEDSSVGELEGSR